MRERAIKSYTRCIALAMSAYPRSFKGQSWFDEAEEELKKLQEERDAEEAKKQEERLKPTYDKLKDVLEALEKVGKVTVNHFKF